IAGLANDTVKAVEAAFDRFEFSKALEAVWSLISAIDKFIVERAPWKLARQTGDEERRMLDSTLYTAAETLRIVCGLLSPVLPASTAKIWSQLGFTTSIELLRTSELHWGHLPAGQKL